MAKGTLKISGADSFTAADLAPDSVGTSEIAALAVDTAELAADAVDGTKIADNAVDSEHIAADSIDAEHYAPGSVDATAIANDAVDSQHYAADSIDAEHYAPASVDTTAMAASVIGVKPHIIPDVLYPAVNNIMMDGSTALSASTTGPNSSTVQSSKYGTVQSDGRMYYYTDIKGSKPIKDPRIGAHFGSQRHTCDSLQLLEQETAMHGMNVYSIDGREWLRATQGSGETLEIQNNNNGCRVVGNGANTGIEFTGYFKDVNFLNQTYGSDTRSFTVTLDGTTGSEVNTFNAPTTPLGGRFVDAGSVLNLGLSTTLGIHTVRIACHSASDWVNYHAIELIAQDTTSTTTKSKIQIPAQNVVSYGKKFAIPATAQHYDPFNGFTNGDSVTAYVDTATSLGIEGWKNSSTYYRPYNGGRVVRWVASDGTIKTSVNMMPPNAQNVGGTAISAKANASVANNTYLPTFSGAIDHSQAEVAKTSHWREFGNGNANGGNSGTYKDASMLTTGEQDIAYVMDDGLTSLSGNVKEGGGNLYRKDADSFSYLTFIGTGITKITVNGTYHVVQNLPYGTHVFKQDMDSSTVAADWYIDGVKIADIAGGSPEYEGEMFFEEMSIHQPKMPPIPEDAVVIADYMLMADFVPQTVAGLQYISKGVRSVSGSRDTLYDGNGAINHDITNYMPPTVYQAHSTSNLARIPAFGTNIVKRTYKAVERYQNFYINDTAHSSADATTKVGTGHGSAYYPTSSVVLGNNVFETYGGGQGSDGNDTVYVEAWEIVSPIHTSSHYQFFETPFLHELVGGDRNMEQTNLVVTPDGKSWDEVTRDTSYIGPSTAVALTRDGGHVNNAVFIWDFTRGEASKKSMIQKNIAIAYDRLIILEDGIYELGVEVYANVDAAHFWLLLNSTTASDGNGFHIRMDVNDNPTQSSWITKLKRGDYLYSWVPSVGSYAIHGAHSGYNQLTITKLN